MSEETQLILPDGQVVTLGCNVPDVRPLTFSAYGDSEQLLSEQEIQELVSRPSRVWGRKFWNEPWIANQGQVGSCNAYAAVRALMRVRSIKGLPPLNLSAEFVYANINGGQDRGSMLDDGMEWITAKGTCPQDMVPHQTWQKHKLRPETFNEAGRYRARECYRVDNEQELASGLALGFVGVVAVHANNTFMRLDQNGVVNSTDGMGNHAVLVDDVRIQGGELQFDMANSWGTGYGQRGRGWISWRRHLQTTTKYHAFYLIRDAADDPQGNNPPDMA